MNDILVPAVLLIVMGTAYVTIVISLVEVTSIDSRVWTAARHSKPLWLGAFVVGLLAPVIGIVCVVVYQLTIHKDLVAARDTSWTSPEPLAADTATEVMPPAEATPASGMVADLHGLSALHDRGALTDNEFEAAKRQLLADQR